jgi:3-deoxy-D-manno-octulosonic-acid transferase
VASQIASAEILLLDTIGELAAIFELADVVFMGGSLAPAGGHNLLEPAFWARPIVCGPHMWNFRDIVELFLQAGAARQVRDTQELSRAILELLADAARRRALGQAAKHVLENHAGATERVLEHMKEWLGTGIASRAGG